MAAFTSLVQETCWIYDVRLQFIFALVYLVFFPLDSLSHRDEIAVDVSIETGLISVSTGEAELSNEGDGRQDLAVIRSVGDGLRLGLGAGTEDGACEHQDTNNGQPPDPGGSDLQGEY